MSKEEYAQLDDYLNDSPIKDCKGKLSEFDGKVFVISNVEPYVSTWNSKSIEGVKVTVDGKKWYTARDVVTDQCKKIIPALMEGKKFKVRMVKPHGKKYFELQSA